MRLRIDEATMRLPCKNISSTLTWQMSRRMVRQIDETDGPDSALVRQSSSLTSWTLLIRNIIIVVGNCLLTRIEETS